MWFLRLHNVRIQMICLVNVWVVDYYVKFVLAVYLISPIFALFHALVRCFKVSYKPSVLCTIKIEQFRVSSIIPLHSIYPIIKPHLKKNSLEFCMFGKNSIVFFYNELFVGSLILLPIFIANCLDWNCMLHIWGSSALVLLPLTWFSSYVVRFK